MLNNSFKLVWITVLVLVLFLLLNNYNNPQKAIHISPYPAGYNFAFTITDDPDDGWIEEKKVVYDFLDSLGMKTSIGVWVFDNKTGSGNLSYYYQGVTLENPEYLASVKSLKNKGFELFLHTVTGGNDERNETIAGFETYKKYFGEYPNHWINHFTNYENMYWGYKRFNNPVMRWVYRIYKHKEFQGDDPQSKYFWGDLCQKHIKYVRGWATSDLNTLKFNPSMPYHDPYKPYVKYWYACSDGENKNKFNKLIISRNVDKLIQEKGTSIIYTHFAKGFVDKNGNLNADTKKLLAYIASHKNGWFVPINVMMERFEANRSIKVYEEDDRYIIVNTGKSALEKLEIEATVPEGVYYNGNLYKGTIKEPSKLIINSLNPGVAINIMKAIPINKQYLDFSERICLSTSWLISRFY
jgi:hypothetical protein